MSYNVPCCLWMNGTMIYLTIAYLSLFSINIYTLRLELYSTKWLWKQWKVWDKAKNNVRAEIFQISALTSSYLSTYIWWLTASRTNIMWVVTRCTRSVSLLTPLYFWRWTWFLSSVLHDSSVACAMSLCCVVTIISGLNDFARGTPQNTNNIWSKPPTQAIYHII